MSTGNDIMSTGTAEADTAVETELDDARWAVIERRDSAAISLFIYGVRTTGVFCRPGCPARTPLRSNIEFFGACDEAKAAGYRACKRCRPTEATTADPSVATIADICRRLECHGEAPTVAALAGDVGWSARHLSRTFKSVTGVTPAAYGRSVRADRARRSLVAGSEVTDAAFDAGFGSLRAFYEHGASRLGMTPGVLRDGASATTIGYAIAPCALGVVQVAATARGVCSVRLGHEDEVESMRSALIDEHPQAEVIEDPDGLAELVSLVVELAAGRPSAAVDLPLDVQGTAFQVAVWEALRSLPTGDVASYGDIARSLGRPSAHRAVANACAANKVALIVPCHRVIRADGKPGGYRWGADRKTRLLAAEAS